MESEKEQVLFLLFDFSELINNVLLSTRRKNEQAGAELCQALLHLHSLDQPTKVSIGRYFF